jgi:hypothetical protein
MLAYSVEKVIAPNGTVQLEALPFPPGAVVEVIVLARKPSVKPARVQTLKHSVLKYDQPFAPVAAEDWDALR